MAKLIKKSQLPLPGMDALPMGGGEDQPPPQQAGEDNVVIPGPLDSAEKIIVDSDVRMRLMDADNLEDIALKIWEDYGGKRSGGAYRNKRGKRTEAHEDRERDDVLQDIEGGKEPTDQRWLRLPKGDTIADITSMQGLFNALEMMVQGVLKTLPTSGGGQQGGGQPGGGGLPGL